MVRGNLRIGDGFAFIAKFTTFTVYAHDSSDYGEASPSNFSARPYQDCANPATAIRSSTETGVEMCKVIAVFKNAFDV